MKSLELKEQLNNYLSQAGSRVYRRMDNNGEVPFGLTESDKQTASQSMVTEISGRALKYIADSNNATRVWYLPELVNSRDLLRKRYPTEIFEAICIDGRIFRAFRLPAYVSKVDAGLVTLEKTPSSGNLLPADPEIFNSFRELSSPPLEVSYAHDNNCAATKLMFDQPNNLVFQHIFTPHQRSLVYEAKARGGYEYANQVMLEIANRIAFENQYGIMHEPRRIGVTALYNIRTTGVTLRSPIIKYTNGIPELSHAYEQETLGSSEVSADIERIQSQVKDPNMPAIGKYNSTFMNTGFPEFYDEMARLTLALWDGKFPETEVSLDPAFSSVAKRIKDFLRKNYSDLDSNQRGSLGVIMLASAVRERLMGDTEFFSHHAERFISCSDSADNVGKYVPEYQSLRIHTPGSTQDGRRVNIGRIVLDAHGPDRDKPHILFIGSSNGKKGCIELFRKIIGSPEISQEIDKGRVMPIGVVFGERGIVTEIPEENAMYI